MLQNLWIRDVVQILCMSVFSPFTCFSLLGIVFCKSLSNLWQARDSDFYLPETVWMSPLATASWYFLDFLLIYYHGNHLRNGSHIRRMKPLDRLQWSSTMVSMTKIITINNLCDALILEILTVQQRPRDQITGASI